MGTTEGGWLEPIMKRGEKSSLLYCNKYIRSIGMSFCIEDENGKVV